VGARQVLSRRVPNISASGGLRMEVRSIHTVTGVWILDFQACTV
jgi:hypothetical protein